MKKVVFLLCIFFSTITFQVSAENVLVITNPKSGESDIIKKGSFLVFELKADKSMHNGLIRAINDSSLEFDDGQVSFSQINILGGVAKSRIAAGHVANAIGNVLIVAGSATFNCGLNFFMYNDYYYWPIGGTVWAAGAFVAGLGYMIDWATPNDHRLRTRNYRGWQAHIVSEENIQAQQKQLEPPADSINNVMPNNTDKPKKEKKKTKSSTGDDVYGD